MHAAVVTGSAGIQVTLPGLRKSMGNVLSAFAPRAKERPQDMAGEGEIDLLIATDCISEGQNLQDCDWLINYDIHWNPVRIIQRFGRIDRIGSPNQRIQLVNFWPNMELEEYINLEQRVSGRMVLLDVSATGEENLIEQQSGNAMNDLEYRRKQLLAAGHGDRHGRSVHRRGDHRPHPDRLPHRPRAVPKATPASWTPSRWGLCGHHHAGCRHSPGVIFCLQACGPTAKSAASSDYPLAPHYLVHVGDDGHVLLPYPQAKRILDRLKRLALGRERPDDSACARFDKATKAVRTCATPRSCSRRPWHPSPASMRNGPLPASSHLAARTP